MYVVTAKNDAGAAQNPELGANSLWEREGQKAVSPREGQCLHRLEMKEHVTHREVIAEERWLWGLWWKQRQAGRGCGL